MLAVNERSTSKLNAANCWKAQAQIYCLVIKKRTYLVRSTRYGKIGSRSLVKNGEWVGDIFSLNRLFDWGVWLEVGWRLKGGEPPGAIMGKGVGDLSLNRLFKRRVWLRRVEEFLWPRPRFPQLWRTIADMSGCYGGCVRALKIACAVGYKCDVLGAESGGMLCGLVLTFHPVV